MDWLEKAWEDAYRKISMNLERFSDLMPNYTVDGKYRLEEDGGWTGGFWTGILWKLYEKTKESKFLETARACQVKLAKRLEERQDTLDHDTGYLYTLSFVADYKLTGDELSRCTALKAARLLQSRFHEKSGVIRSWTVPYRYPETNGRHEVEAIATDGSMLNLCLLYWAACQTGSEQILSMALSHSKAVQQYNIRNDFSSYNIYIFDPDTGSPICGRSSQGMHDESCWSRGEAYHLYGFAMAYRYTGKREFLETARGIADYFIRNLDSDLVPLWDFGAAGMTGQEKDSSAAAVASAGLLELSSLVDNCELSKYYSDKAYDILQSLYLNYSTKDDPTCEGLLLHGCGCRKDGISDNSLIYGDYFYIESLLKLSADTTRLW